IPNAFEMNNCGFYNPPFYGTNPAVADSDGDGIKDGDEAFGTTAGLNLPSFGCLPCRKDLLVETDWLRTTAQAVNRNKLNINQVVGGVAAFNGGVTANPNGVNGIKLQIDYGQAPFNNGNEVIDPNNNDMLDVTNDSLDGGEFITVKNANFAANRHGYFHY